MRCISCLHDLEETYSPAILFLPDRCYFFFCLILAHQHTLFTSHDYKTLHRFQYCYIEVFISLLSISLFTKVWKRN